MLNIFFIVILKMTLSAIDPFNGAFFLVLGLSKYLNNWLIHWVKKKKKITRKQCTHISSGEITICSFSLFLFFILFYVGWWYQSVWLVFYSSVYPSHIISRLKLINNDFVPRTISQYEPGNQPHQEKSYSNVFYSSLNHHEKKEKKKNDPTSE